MSRRPAPHPAVPVGGAPDGLLTPQAAQSFSPPPQEQVLYSTDPNEAPQPPDAPPGYVPPGAPVGGANEPFYRDEGVDSAPEDEGEPLSPEEDVMFASLLTCGRRSKTIKILDHVVTVQTLNGDDDLRIGLFVKPYVGSLGEQRSYQIAVAAAGLRTIDSKPFGNALFKDADDDALFDEKIETVKKMYPHVISRVYRAVMDAEKEFVELVTRLGKSDG